jgi:hypothetical protein
MLVHSQKKSARGAGDEDKVNLGKYLLLRAGVVSGRADI